MSRSIFLIASLFFLLTTLGCRKQKNLIGYWRPVKFTYWTKYPTEGVKINLKTRQVLYDSTDVEMIERMTPKYIDSLLEFQSISYLNLKKDNSFTMEDHGFFSIAILDTAWQLVHTGKWKARIGDSVLILSQTYGLSKHYKLLRLEGDTLVIGELYQDQEREPSVKDSPMTEIILNR
jgi:hypothetical protein